MTSRDEDFRALADFMEWVDPEGYADILCDTRRCQVCGHLHCTPCKLTCQETS